MEILLTPKPKKMSINKGVFSFNNAGYILVDDRALFPVLKTICNAPFSNMEISLCRYVNRAPDIILSRDKNLNKEGYKLTITPENISIEYGEFAGAFYALITLRQLTAGRFSAPCVEIEDYPLFAIRGYMLDIGRGKIPRLSTIFETIDRLCELKYNHLELYMEGSPFAYPSFPEMWENDSVITGDEFMAIDEYCKARFIELVPNHNTFGHMTEWLKKLPDDMKICPDGFYYEPWDMHSPCATSLNPLDKRSFNLVKQMSDDLFPYFTSNKINVGCDEVLELGLGKTAGFSKEKLGEIVYDYLMKLYNYCKENGKTMMFWSDMVLEHPEILSRFPRDIVALNWGYEPNEPTEESCILCEKNGIPFCVCPGTGCWSTYTGKTGQMLGNIKNATEKGMRHNALGVLLTDWGDCGHAQGYATSIPGITYCGAVMWGLPDNKDIDLAAAIDRLLGTNGVGQFMLDVGSWHKMETLWLKNQTVTEKIMKSDYDALNLREIPVLCECISHSLLDEITAFLDDCLYRLNHLDLTALNDSEAIFLEYRAGINAVKLGQLCGHYKLYLIEENVEGRRKTLEQIIELVPAIVRDFEHSWTVKNKYSHLPNVINFFKDKAAKAKEILKTL